mgnify:CR=1 FL=1
MTNRVTSDTRSGSRPVTGPQADDFRTSMSGNRPEVVQSPDGFRTVSGHWIFTPFCAQSPVRSSTQVRLQTLTLKLLYNCRLHVDRSLVPVQGRESHKATRVCVYSCELARVDRNARLSPVMNAALTRTSMSGNRPETVRLPDGFRTMSGH